MGFISNPFFLLFLLSFVLSSTFSFSVAHPNIIHHFQDEQFSALDGNGLATRWNTMNVTAETSAGNSTYLILAAERTHRRDPIDNFQYYTDGWNLTNPHYLFSTGLASVGPFIVAVLWFIVFGVWLLCMCICCCCCCSRKPYGYSQTAYTLSLIFLGLFTLAVLIGSVFIFIGQERFETSIVDVMSYVLHRADTTIVKLMDLFNHMMAAKDVGIGQLTLPDEQKRDVDEIGSTINDLYRAFRYVTSKDKDEIKTFLYPLRQILICVAVVVIVVALLGFLFSILGVECLVYTLVIIGWIIVTVTFIMSGIFLLVNNLVGDTCVAMNEWLHNPTADSALENIIPKVDNETTQQILCATKNVTYGVVEVANAYISTVSNNANVTSDMGPLYYNQSGPLMPLLCNPYNSNDTHRHCAPGEVDFNNASHVWNKYVCEVSWDGNCVTPGRLTPRGYKQITALVNASSGLYDGIPFVIELMDGTFLTKTLSDLSIEYCSNLHEYSQWVYAGLITSSTALMLSLIQWLVHCRQRRRRAYTNKADAALYRKPVA